MVPQSSPNSIHGIMAFPYYTCINALFVHYITVMYYFFLMEMFESERSSELLVLNNIVIIV